MDEDSSSQQRRKSDSGMDPAAYRYGFAQARKAGKTVASLTGPARGGRLVLRLMLLLGLFAFLMVICGVLARLAFPVD